MSNDACLIVGAGILQTYLIREAQHLGLYVIATDGNAQAPGASLCDEFYHLSTYDIDGHRALAHQLMDRHSYTMRGCCTAGADVSPTVAAVTEVWGTPGIPYDVAMTTHDKALVRVLLREQRLQEYQPQWCLCGSLENAKRVAAQIGYPVVAKPIQERASRGISIVADSEHLYDAWNKAKTYSADNVLLEQRLLGTEHSAEILLKSAYDPLWFNIVDRQFDYTGGLAIETGHVNPTVLSRDDQDRIYHMILEASYALGVYVGPFKADVMVTDDGPKILEVTARLSGGFDSQMTSPLSGRHPMRTLLQLACGMSPEIPPRLHEAQCFAACAAVLPQRTGTLAYLPTLLDVGYDDALTELVWCATVGDPYAPLEHNGARLGFVFRKARTSAQAWTFARAAAEALAAAVEMV